MAEWRNNELVACGESSVEENSDEKARLLWMSVEVFVYNC